ncbi:MAG: SPOR domain-containing protein [Fusobacteria bacterium]|nr:SPOR domain-containing protein [Fusobacteriota bacterium]
MKNSTDNDNYNELDKYEELYINSVLGTNKIKKEEPKKRYKTNDTGIFIIAFIVALIILGLIILAIDKKEKKDKKISTEIGITYETIDSYEGKTEEIQENTNIVTEIEEEINFESTVIANQIPEKTVKKDDIITIKEVNTTSNIKSNVNIKKTIYVIQLIASNSDTELKKEVVRLKKRNISAKIIEDSKILKYKLILSTEFQKRDDADKYMNQLKNQKLIPNDAWIRTIEKK